MRIELLLARGSFLAAALAVPLFSDVSDARAQDCQVDSDCGGGYRCATMESTVCNACPPPDGWGRDGGVPSGDGGVPSGDGGFLPWPPFECDAGCTPYTYRYCTRANCAADSDCPDDMVCHTDTWSECTFGCKPDSDNCEADGGFSCSDHTESTCNERYNLPCADDTSCGAGFDCNRNPYTFCTGGGGIVFGDGGFTILDGGSNCTTETPEAGYCNLLELPCDTTADCPAALTCQPTYEYPPCVVYPSDGGASDGGVTRSLDGGFVNYECPPPVTKNVCRPERWGGGGLIGGTFGGTLSGGSFGGGLIGGGDPGQDAGAPTGNGALGGLAGGTTAGTVGGFGGGGSSDAGSASPGQSDGDDDGDSEEGQHGGHHGHGWHKGLRGWFGSGGCSLGGETADGNLAWFALLSGLLVLRTRRRSER